MADEEELRCGSTFGQNFEADLEIIYSKYCRPFDEEEILLSAYADKDDKSFEELFTDIAEGYDSDSEYDSDASGLTSRANTSQDSLSELDEESAQSSSVIEKIINRRKGHNLTTGSEDLDCYEDFPMPIAESTRRDSDHEALDMPQHTCDSEGILKSPAEKDKSTEAVIGTSLYSPTKPSDTTNRLSVDNQVRNQLHINNVDTTATPGSHDLAKIVFQARNRIANALVDAFKSRNSSQKRTRVHHKQKKNTNLLSVRWAPASPTATKKSIKQLSGDNSGILPENFNIPSVARPLPPSYLKERIIVKSRVHIAKDPNSDFLTIRCSPKSVESLHDIKLPERKWSIALPTNRAVKSSFQCGDQEQRLNSIVLKRPALNNPGVGAVKHSVRLPTHVSPASSQAFTPDMQIRGITGRKGAEHSSGGPLGISDTQRKGGNSADMDRIKRKDALLSVNCHALQKGSCASFTKLMSTASNTRPNGKMTASVGKQKPEVACTLTSTDFSSKQNGRKSSASGNGSDAMDKETGNKNQRKLATNGSSRNPSRSELSPSTGGIFTFERHEKLVEQSNMLSELLRVGRRTCRTQSGPLSRGNERFLKQCLSDIAATTPNKCLQSESTFYTTTYHQNSKAKLLTLRKKDSQSNAKKTGSTRLTKTAVSSTTSGKQLDTDNSAHLLTTSPFKKTNEKGKTSKSVVRPSQAGHQTTHLTVHEALCVNKSNSRKRNADSETCGAAYRVSKKVCMVGDKAGFANDTNNVATQLLCRGPGKCRKSFCFKCCQLSG